MFGPLHGTRTTRQESSGVSIALLGTGKGSEKLDRGAHTITKSNQINVAWDIFVALFRSSSGGMSRRSGATIEQTNKAGIVFELRFLAPFGPRLEDTLLVKIAAFGGTKRGLSFALQIHSSSGSAGENDAGGELVISLGKLQVVL